MTKRFSFYFILAFTVSLFSQEPVTMDLIRAESELADLFTRLYSDNLSETEPLLARIREIMTEVLAHDGAMDFPWEKLNMIGVVPSDDGMLRIFTWHVMEDMDHYRYFGYIQVLSGRDKIRVYELRDNLKAQRNIQKLRQSTEDWYGKLYYKIITENYKRKPVYTLLGMDFNDSRSTIKSVETMTIQRNKPQFLQDLFFNGRDRIDRLLLEYSSQVTISVRYDPRIRMITFDHLVPFHPVYNGNYEFYGPDGSYDGLQFEAGSWIYREDIDVRNLD